MFFQKFRYSRYSRYSRKMLQSRRNITLTMVCLFSPKPRLPQINFIDGGVFGERVKNIYYFIFCWGGAFPLSHWYVLNPCSFGLGLPSSPHFFVVQHSHTTIGLCGSFNYYFHLLLLRRWICNFWWYILFWFSLSLSAIFLRLNPER